MPLGQYVPGQHLPPVWFVSGQKQVEVLSLAMGSVMNEPPVQYQPAEQFPLGADIPSTETYIDTLIH